MAVTRNERQRDKGAKVLREWGPAALSHGAGGTERLWEVRCTAKAFAQGVRSGPSTTSRDRCLRLPHERDRSPLSAQCGVQEACDA